MRRAVPGGSLWSTTEGSRRRDLITFHPALAPSLITTLPSRSLPLLNRTLWRTETCPSDKGPLLSLASQSQPIFSICRTRIGLAGFVVDCPCSWPVALG